MWKHALFWKQPARIKLIHRALFFFFLARGFSIILSYLSWWFWKMVSMFNFTFLHFFYFDVIVLTVIFFYTQKCCGSFPFENLLKVLRFQSEEWHVLCTGHVWVLQTSLHRTVLALRSKSLVSSWESFPFYSSLRKGSNWCWSLVQLFSY